MSDERYSVCPEPAWIDWVLSVGTYNAGLDQPLQFVAVLALELRRLRGEITTAAREAYARGCNDERAAIAAWLRRPRPASDPLVSACACLGKEPLADAIEREEHITARVVPGPQAGSVADGPTPRPAPSSAPQQVCVKCGKPSSQWVRHRHPDLGPVLSGSGWMCGKCSER